MVNTVVSCRAPAAAVVVVVVVDDGGRSRSHRRDPNRRWNGCLARRDAKHL